MLESKRKLIILITICVLPLWVVAALLLYTAYQAKLSLIIKHSQDTAHAVMKIIDQDLLVVESSLEALAVSHSIEEHDLYHFYFEAKEVARKFTNADIILADLTGQQLVNTYKIFGETLPRRNIPGNTLQQVSKGKPCITSLYKGAVTGRYLISIA